MSCISPPLLRSKPEATPRKKSPKVPSPLELEVKIDKDLYSSANTASYIPVTLKLNVFEHDVTLDSLELELQRAYTPVKPTGHKCEDCACDTITLSRQAVFSGSQTFPPGRYMFHVVLEMDQHAPPTFSNRKGSLEYRVVGMAHLADGEVREQVALPGYLPISGHDDGLVTRRVSFPELSVDLSHPAAMYLEEDFTAYLSLSSTSKTTQDSDLKSAWEVRRMEWRIEEHETSIVPVCDRHRDQYRKGAGAAKETTRIIADGSVKSLDADSAHKIGTEINISIPKKHHPCPDVQLPGRLRITHTLVLELAITEVIPATERPKRPPSGVVTLIRPRFDMAVLPGRAPKSSLEEKEILPRYEEGSISPPEYRAGKSE